MLAAVEQELSRRKPRWERAVECSVAASLALGIGLNAWNAYSESKWLRGISGVRRQQMADGDIVKPHHDSVSAVRFARGPDSQADPQELWKAYNRLLKELAASAAFKL